MTERQSSLFTYHANGCHHWLASKFAITILLSCVSFLTKYNSQKRLHKTLPSPSPLLWVWRIPFLLFTITFRRYTKTKMQPCRYLRDGEPCTRNPAVSHISKQRSFHCSRIESMRHTYTHGGESSFFRNQRRSLIQDAFLYKAYLLFEFHRP